MLRTPARNRWTMTERGADALTQTTHSLTIGPSALEWRDDRLIVRIDERTHPLPGAVRGRVMLRPVVRCEHSLVLDRGGRHRWTCIAPLATADVELTAPSLRWSGPGYFDTNVGSSPLEDVFARWSWSCAHLRNAAAVCYDVEEIDGYAQQWSLQIARDGRATPFPAGERCELPSSRWRIARSLRSQDPRETRVQRTLLDAPFYARSLVRARRLGEPALVMHESLDLQRFRSPLVQWMLGFRMARER